jgi:hypothetical protein
LIRVYRFNTNNNNNRKQESDGSDERKAKKARIDLSQQSSGEISEEKDENQLISYYGSLERSTGIDRCSSLSLNAKHNVLAGQSAGKTIDVSEFLLLFADFDIVPAFFSFFSFFLVLSYS